jgi:precorrin-4/cobalt-precorrin-4 C11-methyltransferase
MRSLWGLLCMFCLLFVSASVVLGSESASRPGGKFYIVGMGSAPDLVTLRALETIRYSDIVIIESEYEKTLWKDYIEGKEVWFCPHDFRVFYGMDPALAKNERMRAKAERAQALRKNLVERIQAALQQGKVVSSLQSGDPMMYGITLFLELLPKDTPSEIIPGVGAFQAVSAAVKMSPPYGYDTSAVVLTMADWPGRIDSNEKLMEAGSSMIFYTMLLDYQELFPQLQRHYPADTPVAVVIDAGDRQHQEVLRSTVGRFLEDVDYKSLPPERHTLLVGKFLTVGQMRKDFVPEIEKGQ